MVAEAIGLGSRAESSPANRVHLCLRSPHHVKKLLRQSLLRRPTALREDSPPYHVNVNGAHNKLRFIDLFCGIGGFRLAFERAGCECVFSCDWNEKARETYKANFGEAPHGDIHAIAVADIPEHDILCAGFPCQPFSIAGVSKKLSLGRKHGFEDKEQGNLFFSLAEIIEFHQPAAFVLENVKNLRSHDQGRTFQIIMQTLEEHLGYRVYPKVIDAQSVVPQHRERINLNSEKFLCGGNE
jgi:DNA (cytosine-5)-methyltransferase 1